MKAQGLLRGTALPGNRPLLDHAWHRVCRRGLDSKASCLTFGPENDRTLSGLAMKSQDHVQRPSHVPQGGAGSARRQAGRRDHRGTRRPRPGGSAACALRRPACRFRRLPEEGRDKCGPRASQKKRPGWCPGRVYRNDRAGAEAITLPRPPAAGRLRPSAWLPDPRRSAGRPSSSTAAPCRARRIREASP